MRFEAPPTSTVERPPFAGWEDREVSMIERAARLSRHPEAGKVLHDACLLTTKRLFAAREH